MKKIIFFLLGVLINGFTTAQTNKNLTLLDSIQFPGQRLSGCWHYNHAGGKEYALIGATHGIVIIDISNPVNTDTIFQLPGAESLWHEVKVNGDFAYAVSEGSDSTGVKNGVQIIDLRFLPDSAPSKFYQGDSLIANQLITAHTVTTSSHYLFVNGHNLTSLNRGVLILDIVDPLFPKFIGAITNRYCHDSYVRGDRIYTSDIIDGMFSVYDITVPSNPLLLATQITPGQFNHNTWLSDNGLTLFAADEKPNVPMASYDISDLNNITLLDTFYNINLSGFEVHNVRVINDFVLNPSYGSQLTIVDAARPRNLIEVGNYLTGNSLCWDSDPYANSGNIIATDMNSGTFYLFGAVYKRACYLEGTVTDSVTGLPINNASIQILLLSVNDISDFVGEYQTGFADSGTYIVDFSKAGYISRQLTVNLQNGVLTTLDVKLVPLGTGTLELSEGGIEIFPNPVNEILNINSPDYVIENWEISDGYGRIIRKNESGFSHSKEFSIDVRSLAAGIYIVNLETPKRRIKKTILKH